MKTRAAVCREFGQPLIIETIDLAEPGPGEVRVQMKACAICHSDIFYMDGAWGGDLPAVYGHEAAGIVESVGAGVTRIKPGDHVIATLIRNCGFCSACAGGSPVACEEVFPLDRSTPIHGSKGEPMVHGMRTGAFAEYAVVEQSQVAKIAEDIAFESAALIACGVITGFGAVVNTANVHTGASVVVIGCGGVGLNSVQGARIAGAQPIIAIDVADSKLEAARSFGATHVINARTENVAERILEINGGHNVDFAFVTVGIAGAAEQAIAMLRKNGAAVLVGMPPNGVSAHFDPGSIAAAGQRILGSKMGSTRLPVDVPNIIALYREGRLKLDELISGRFSLDKINEAVASSRSGAALRNVIVF